MQRTDHQKRLSVVFRNYFLTGLIVWFPILITFYVIVVIVKFADSILGRIINKILMRELGYSIPGLGLVVALLLLVFTGFIVSRFVRWRIVRAVEGIFYRLPIVKNIYPSVKQLTDFVFSKEKFGLKKVVLAEYPSPGMYQIGFITQDHIREFNEKTNKELIGVMIPTTPSPLTGFLAFLPKEKIIVLEMRVEDAMKLVISGGVVKPSTYA